MDKALSDSLGREITSGARRSGSVLRLDELTTQFGVSRTVARDAVRELESLGLVESRRSVGIEVLPPERWSVFHPKVIMWRTESTRVAAQLRSLTELRLAIEPIAAAYAAQRRTASQAGELLSLAHRMYDSGLFESTPASAELDVRFHRLILTAAHNEMFAAMGDSVAAAITARIHAGLASTDPPLNALDAHMDVARAIQRRDQTAAQDIMRGLIADVVIEMYDWPIK